MGSSPGWDLFSRAWISRINDAAVRRALGLRPGRSFPGREEIAQQKESLPTVISLQQDRVVSIARCRPNRGNNSRGKFRRICSLAASKNARITVKTAVRYSTPLRKRSKISRITRRRISMIIYPNDNRKNKRDCSGDFFQFFKFSSSDSLSFHSSQSFSGDGDLIQL